MKTRKPTHPGAVFREDVLLPLHLSVTEAAERLGVSRKQLSLFCNERAALSPEMALRIGEATGTSPESWLAMQSKLTLWEASQVKPHNVQSQFDAVALTFTGIKIALIPLLWSIAFVTRALL
jgi:addiction module HigA family antidote